MKLKKIRMIGFKSFADETVIDTGEGITAIVGPNGCGKSNILDAVRWVLGEKSARGLRGKSMEDVIFLGSEYRKPAGMAEVEMVFDNTDRSLPLDQDSIQVGRRIYLNTGSEFLLNGKRTTRREIEKVFLDTGIGKSAYSIMEQGRMSEILRASPEDRRSLFDEAAGVSRFKSNRQEALDRLADTDQNLLRLGDILKSKESELRNLERQAEKTRSYLKLKEHLDRHDRNLRYLKLLDLERRREKADKKLQQFLERRDEIFRRISESDGQIETLEKETGSLLENMHALDREYHQALAEMDSLEKNLERLETDRNERTAALADLKKRLQAEEGRSGEIKKRMQQSMQLELDLNTELQTLENSAQKLQAAIEKRREEIARAEEQEVRNRSELEELEERQAALLEDLKNVAREVIEELEARKVELQNGADKREQLKEMIRRNLLDQRETLEQAIREFENKKTASALELLRNLRTDELLGDFNEFEKMDGDLRSFLFGKEGLLARKEALDHRMDELTSRRDELIAENARLAALKREKGEELEKFSNQKIETDLQIRDSQVRRESSQEARESITAQLKESQDAIAYYSGQVTVNEKQLSRLESEAGDFRSRISEIEKRNEKQIVSIEEIKGEVARSRAGIDRIRENARSDRETVENILPEISEQERKAEGIQVALSSLEEDLYNDFQLSVGELTEQCESAAPAREKEESDFRRIRLEIQNLGQFNPLAIEELERCRESHEQIVEQRRDVNEARNNIVKILDDINNRSRAMFLDTFKRIENNFSEVFQSLFNGGRATLTLTEPEDPLNCGIDIMVQPPGKKNTSITLLSGGEQNLTAIALMFATYLVRPSPFCFLDEIDAPLDDTNVNRFLRMLGGFASRSQFLVITHNKLTMTRSGGLFGVTQEEPGVSKIVSVQIRDQQNQAG